MSASKRLAIFGHPVDHSRSPQLHRLFARQCGIEISYEKLDAPPGMLAAMLPPFALNGGVGANVTLPHKEAAFALATTRSERAQGAGSANTLRLREDGGWDADNTDGAGFLTDLRHNLGFAPAGMRVLLVGAGGAARGVLDALLSAMVERVTVVNRTLATAQALVATFKSKSLDCAALEDAGKHGPYELVINATSAGLSGHLPALPKGLFFEQSLAYDLIYGQGALPFLNWAKAQGAGRCADGLGMFIEQGALSFEYWFGVRPDTEGIGVEGLGLG